MSARAKELERRFRRRVSPADDHDPSPVVRVRLAIVMMHVRQIFAGHADQVGMIVVPDRKDDVAREPGPPSTVRGLRLHREDRAAADRILRSDHLEPPEPGG